jgi:hypothetical protein
MPHAIQLVQRIWPTFVINALPGARETQRTSNAGLIFGQRLVNLLHPCHRCTLLYAFSGHVAGVNDLSIILADDRMRIDAR